MIKILREKLKAVGIRRVIQSKIQNITTSQSLLCLRQRRQFVTCSGLHPLGIRLQVNVGQNICNNYVISLATGPKSFPMRVLQTIRSNATSFEFQNFPFSLRTSIFLCLLPRLLILISLILSSFNNMFHTAVLTKDLTIPVCLLLFYCTQDVPFSRFSV